MGFHRFSRGLKLTQGSPIERSIVVSALRAYYTSVVSFDDFTDSRTFLDLFSAIEPATSIIVASSLVLGPVVKKWFHRADYTVKSTSSVSKPKSTTHNFQRIEDGTSSDVFENSKDIELGNMATAVHGSTRPGIGSRSNNYGDMDSRFNDTQRLTIQEGKGISVQKDFVVNQEN